MQNQPLPPGAGKETPDDLQLCIQGSSRNIGEVLISKRGYVKRRNPRERSVRFGAEAFQKFFERFLQMPVSRMGDRELFAGQPRLHVRADRLRAQSRSDTLQDV